MIGHELLPRNLFEDLYRAQRPVPLSVDTWRGLHDDYIRITVSAFRDGAQGHCIMTLTPEFVARLSTSGRVFKMVEARLAAAARAALDAWLMDYETQQGWPPRECMHGAEA